MARTQCVYYRAPAGSEPVDDFIDGLDERTQPTIDLQIDRLNAEERWTDFKRRMDAPKRQSPRAAGHDAP